LEEEQVIIKLNNIGVGISGISSFTGMSKANVIKKIKTLSSGIVFPKIEEANQEYEVDELCTYVKSKKNRCYITYAMNKRTRRIIAFIVGARTKDNISKVIMKLKELKPKKIYTDKLNIYPALIDKDIHGMNAYKINHIERFNLTLRTHLKRLSRKTICFSRSIEMLENCLRLYIYKNEKYAMGFRVSEGDMSL
jgi:IS1 family transposase